MSHSTNPRILKLKRLPRGKFTWRVNLKLTPHSYLGQYERYFGNRQNLPEEFFTYLKTNVQGRYMLHEVQPLKGSENKRRKPGKGKNYDYILFDEEVDVMLLKLSFGDLINQIYEIQVDTGDEEKPA